MLEMPARTAAPDRHRRQKLLDWLTDEGQERVRAATVLITRTGGLGGPLAQSLVMAGVGRIVLWHEGVVLEEDRHRMVLMDPEGVGRPRAPQARRALERLGAPHVRVTAFDTRITEAEARDWMARADVAVGAAPTYEERLLLNDAALAAGKPFVDAAMYADEMHVLCARPGAACLRCLVPEPPPWRPDFPVLAAVSALVGNLAASLVVRILAGADGQIPWGEVLHFDAERLQWTRGSLARRPGCPACHGH